MKSERIAQLNELFKSVRENKTYYVEVFETYRVLHLNEKAVKALNDYGFTELKTTYLSSKKYSLTVLNALETVLKELGFKDKNA